MKICSTWTTCYSTGELRSIEVQVQIRTAIPRFDIIGLPQNMIREGRDRILSALASLGVDLNSYRVLVSLNPGDIPKEGSHFDLPILVGILRALGILKDSNIKEFYWGELNLTGYLQPLPDILAHLLYADRLGGQQFVSPSRSTSLDFVRNQLKGELKIIAHVRDLFKIHLEPQLERANEDDEKIRARWVVHTPIDSAWDRLRGTPDQFLLWVLIMLGRHHILLQGIPGCGKTTWCRAAQLLQMPLAQNEWARRFQYQQKLSEQADSIDQLVRAPFESPHHTSTRAALVGGGSGQIIAGAITRAHCGILFLDEFLEFQRDCLESLREPLETKSVTIARKGTTQILNADIQLLAAMNPCRCGCLGSQYLCHCSSTQFSAYQQKLSGPLKDRFHIRVWWRLHDQMRPDEYSLKNIRQKMIHCCGADQIELEEACSFNNSSARQFRNRRELFVSWCRWFDIRRPSFEDENNFNLFLKNVELDDEAVRKHRTAL